MAISEKIELLGKEYYTAQKIGIPGELTLQAIPTVSELDFVTSEDFDQVMVDKILPQAVKEQIDFKNLLEIDYSWLLRCLRILNYGPYYTTNSIFCPKCGRQYGEYTVDFQMINCKPLPEGFKNNFLIKRDEFLEFNGDIEIKMLTIGEAMQAYKDTAFQRPNGMINRELARDCYMVKSISGKINLSPIEIRLKLEKEMSSADFIILKDRINELTDYGLRAGGRCTCPNCHNTDATFIALVDDRFFRPTLGDLRAWKKDLGGRKTQNTAGSKAEDVRKHN